MTRTFKAVLITKQSSGSKMRLIRDSKNTLRSLDFISKIFKKTSKNKYSFILENYDYIGFLNFI